MRRAAQSADPYLRPSFSLSNRMRRLAWSICWTLLFRTSPRPFHSWRAFLLRCFGARLGPHCHFYPRSRIWAPWNLLCADGVSLGDDAEIYNPSPVILRIARHRFPAGLRLRGHARLQRPIVPAYLLPHEPGRLLMGVCPCFCLPGGEPGRGRGARPGFGSHT